MYKSLQRKDKGFTIIEVLIVLAIAGLIMLVVFLAVPALQRNSRNTQRRNDVARVLGAAQEAINNGNGQIAAVTDANVQAAVGQLGYYQVTDVSTANAPSPAANNSTIDTVIVHRGAQCNASNQAEAGPSRQLVAVFTVETGSGTQPQCTES